MHSEVVFSEIAVIYHWRVLNFLSCSERVVFLIQNMARCFDVLQSTYFQDCQLIYFLAREKRQQLGISDHTPEFPGFFLTFVFFEPKQVSKSFPKNYPQIKYHRQIIHKIFGFFLFFFVAGADQPWCSRACLYTSRYCCGEWRSVEALNNRLIFFGDQEPVYGGFRK